MRRSVQKVKPRRAIFWRHQNGTKWWAVPAELGPWWTAAQLFIWWAKAGVWQALFERVKDRDPALGMVFLDGTNIRAHHKAAGAAKKGDSENAEAVVKRLAARVEALAARSASPPTGAARLCFTLTPGQAHELPSAIALLDALPYAPRYVVCDRGYAANRFREALWDRGSRPVIPSKRNEPQVACPKWAYWHRHLVENLWARLKEWRAVATRYEKTAASFMAVICIAAAADHIKT